MFQMSGGHAHATGQSKNADKRRRGNNLPYGKFCTMPINGNNEVPKHLGSYVQYFEEVLQ